MKIVREFTAVESDGTRYTIHELQGEHDMGTNVPGPHLAHHTLGKLRTAEGLSVNYVEKGVYDILYGTDAIRVTSDDHSAP
jgi:hypothetical protein